MKSDTLIYLGMAFLICALLIVLQFKLVKIEKLEAQLQTCQVSWKNYQDQATQEIKLLQAQEQTSALKLKNKQTEISKEAKLDKNLKCEEVISWARLQAVRMNSLN